MPLNKISTRAPKNFNKAKTKTRTAQLVGEIGELQKILYAQSKHSLLVVLQGLDASGKDGLVASVFKGVNPLGCSVKAFKVPSTEERAHDFLWRIHREAPERGMIRIFNRSHYEDVLVPWVEGQIDEKTLKKRYGHINDFEYLLAENNTTILKFYLHISPGEQHDRLVERKTNKLKFWKHNDGDWETAKKFDRYINAYENIFRNCNRPEWIVVPSDQNWYKEYLVAEKIVEALRGMKLAYPSKINSGKG
ncbi:MAG: Polyphosphate:AMP phosphotransferase [Bacteroidetes bacterium]|nr:MAG: Polyphosphate:AMP phosphotransferase [Bacteroidota bacterium]